MGSELDSILKNESYNRGFRPGSLTLNQMQQRYIRETLEVTGWRISGRNGAAEILGLHPNTLRSKMERLGIRHPPRYA